MTNPERSRQPEQILAEYQQQYKQVQQKFEQLQQHAESLGLDFSHISDIAAQVFQMPEGVIELLSNGPTAEDFAMHDTSKVDLENLRKYLDMLMSDEALLRSESKNATSLSGAERSAQLEGKTQAGYVKDFVEARQQE